MRSTGRWPCAEASTAWSKRTGTEVLAAHDVGNLGLAPLPSGFDEANSEHLAGVVPLIDCLAGVEPLVALQPDQVRVEHRSEHLGHLGLAHPGLAFEKEGPTQLQAEVSDHRQAAIGDVVVGRERGYNIFDRVGDHGASNSTTTPYLNLMHGYADTA